jgi:endoglucanase
MDALLKNLLTCHSTPGDEGEVRRVLESAWAAAGWEVRRHGDYAVSAWERSAPPAAPVLLVCAHMDSPGYCVDRLHVGGGTDVVRFGMAELGSPEFEGASAPAVLKTRRGLFRGVLAGEARGDAGEPDLFFELEASEASAAQVRQGDRVCFAPFSDVSGEELSSPFLDNRLGCWLLAKLAGEAASWGSPFRVVLGAAGTEEMGGFGARVLAAQVRPDLVVVLDTTYEAPEQGVRLGGGPVLTLSDASVLLSPGTRDRVSGLLGGAGVPHQTEAYNFSGTDARAFPQAGLACPVLPLLVPTRGNHSPCEQADVRDFEPWLQAVRAVAERYF